MDEQITTVEEPKVGTREWYEARLADRKSWIESAEETVRWHESQLEYHKKAIEEAREHVEWTKRTLSSWAQMMEAEQFPA